MQISFFAVFYLLTVLSTCVFLNTLFWMFNILLVDNIKRSYWTRLCPRSSTVPLTSVAIEGSGSGSLTNESGSGKGQKHVTLPLTYNIFRLLRWRERAPRPPLLPPGTRPCWLSCDSPLLVEGVGEEVSGSTRSRICWRVGPRAIIRCNSSRGLASVIPPFRRHCSG